MRVRGLLSFLIADALFNKNLAIFSDFPKPNARFAIQYRRDSEPKTVYGRG